MHIDLQSYLMKCVSIAIYVCMTPFLPAWKTVGQLNVKYQSNLIQWTNNVDHFTG